MQELIFLTIIYLGFNILNIVSAYADMHTTYNCIKWYITWRVLFFNFEYTWFVTIVVSLFYYFILGIYILNIFVK